MGEWSDYFEDFPEENQANYVGKRFDPAGAEAQREARQIAALKLAKEQRQLCEGIAAIIQKHKPTE